MSTKVEFFVSILVCVQWIGCDTNMQCQAIFLHTNPYRIAELKIRMFQSEIGLHKSYYKKIEVLTIKENTSAIYLISFHLSIIKD